MLYGGASDDRITVGNDSFPRIDWGSGTDVLAFGSESLDASDLTATATGSFDITTYSV